MAVALFNARMMTTHWRWGGGGVGTTLNLLEPPSRLPLITSQTIKKINNNPNGATVPYFPWAIWEARNGRGSPPAVRLPLRRTITGSKKMMRLTTTTIHLWIPVICCQSLPAAPAALEAHLPINGVRLIFLASY